jgi:EmrB/QacA subfamily drug resistance transporter
MSQSPQLAPAPVQAQLNPRRWRALALIGVAQLMLILDVTVVNIALPDMGADLHLGRTALTWSVTAYTLFFGGLMLLGGRLSDTFGARRMMLTGLATFTLASLATGLAQNQALLLSGRITQGIGAAMLSPAALSTVTATFHGTERNRALGIWAALGGFGFALGVLVGGVLTAGPGWRWVFFINVPIGMAVLAALPFTLPALPGRPSRQRIDLPGAFLVTTATAALIYGLVKAGDAGWGAAPALVPMAFSVALYAAFVGVERRTGTPLMRVGMLLRRPVAAGALLMLTGSVLLIPLFFLGSIYLQHIRHLSALKTGLLFLPAAVAITLGAHLGARLLGHLGPRLLGVSGLAATALGLGLLTRLSAQGHLYAVLLPGIVIASFGVGPVFMAATSTALGDAEPHEAGLASGLINTFHELGGAIGVAVVSTIAATGISAGSLTGFTDAFTITAITAAAVAVIALALVPPGRPQLTGGPHLH